MSDNKPLKKIFVSYSRKNSEFAEQLTKELTKKGADVWFDQLSIQPGETWDGSIDRALDEADAILLILSKASVKSENVMDEVGYGLEYNKTIIPVLIEPCDIPFRIQRFTIYDLTKNMVNGMSLLLKSIHLNDSDNTESWSQLEEIKLNTTRTKDIYISVEEDYFIKMRKRNLFLLIALFATVLAERLSFNDLAIFLKVSDNLVYIMVSLLFGRIIEYVLKRFKWTKKYIKRYHEVIAPSILILIIIWNLDFRLYLILYFTIVFLLVQRLPKERNFTDNVLYAWNIIAFLLLAFSISMFAESNVIYIISDMSVNALYGLFVVYVASFLASKNYSVSGFFKQFKHVGFIYTVLILSIIRETLYLQIDVIPLYAIFLIITVIISRTLKNLDWQLFKS